VDLDLNARLDRLAALGEPVRRALYRYVALQTDPVSRDEASRALGVAHHVAKFHLDHLVDDGLLEVEYRRPAGRTGPGAGRPAKLYRRVDADLEVSLPERRYDLAGRLLARAVARAERTHTPVGDAVRAVAGEAGRELGHDATDAGERSVPGARDAAVGALAAHGFEPRSDPSGITLSNCPFHALAQDETELVCGMNQAFVQGVLEGAGATGLSAQLAPAGGRCCVRICAPGQEGR
jgi:predicted ArsR family transcriptional regulator